MIGRREFLRVAGAGAAAAALGAGGCKAGGGALKAGGGGDVLRGREIPADRMTYRTDPMNGNRLSLLGFGMMRLPRVQRGHGESHPDVNDIDQEATNELVDYAIAHGVNVFHTAPMYGKGFSEQATGEALSRHPRENYYIATCLSNQRGDASFERAVRMYNNSFEFLKTDYIDYYFLHNLGYRAAFNRRFADNGVLDFLLREKEAGRIKNLGWSFHGEIDFLEYMTENYPWDFTMINLNYLNYEREGMRAGGSVTDVGSGQLYEVLAAGNVPVWIMGPLLGGRLSNLHHKAREMLTQANPDASIASWGFRFAAGFPNVVTVMSGMTFIDHLQDNILTYSPFVPLSGEERNMLLQAVSQIAYTYPNINCTQCQYCMPCPYGLDIPEIFTHYNRSMNEGNYPVDRQSEDFRRARRAFLVGMDRRVSPVRQAGRCINCKLCIPNCPQRIDIPQQMRRIDRFAEGLKLEA